MIPSLHQFVPSSVCLSCEGCCRFQLADSAWRPKTGERENIPQSDEQGYVPTKAADGRHLCVFLKTQDNTCGIYSSRPFECSLYPFIISKNQDGLKLYMHLACPYIQQEQSSLALQEHIRYLKEFFCQLSVRKFLKDNSRLLHDYSTFEQELSFLFFIDD